MDNVKAKSGWLPSPILRRLARVAYLLALVVLLLLSGPACDTAPDTPDLPDLPLPTVSVADLRPVPAATPTPTAASMAMATATPVIVGIQVPQLTIAEVPADLPAYSRDDWKHWVDADKDCQNTRAEVLVEESTAAPAFKTDRQCQVTGGEWHDPFTNQTFTDPGDLDIDHLVPLKNAHLSGAWQWDAARKEDYANSLAAGYHLIAVDKSANRSKGAKGPEEWQPPNAAYHCQYAQDWIDVKAKWQLTATPAEWQALEEMLATCPVAARIVDKAAAPAPLPTAEAAPTPSPIEAVPGDVPSSGGLVITEIMANPDAVRDSDGEWFEVHNPGGEGPVNLAGWTIQDGERDQHRIAAELIVPAGGYVVLARNGDKAANGGVAADYVYGQFNLTNEADVIELVDASGQVVDRVSYTPALVFAGASTSLSSNALDSVANDQPANWCRAVSAMPNGDYGTPGAANDPC